MQPSLPVGSVCSAFAHTLMFHFITQPDLQWIPCNHFIHLVTIIPRFTLIVLVCTCHALSGGWIEVRPVTCMCTPQASLLPHLLLSGLLQQSSTVDCAAGCQPQRRTDGPSHHGQGKPDKRSHAESDLHQVCGGQGVVVSVEQGTSNRLINGEHSITHK